jgi:hypothetical protein
MGVSKEGAGCIRASSVFHSREFPKADETPRLASHLSQNVILSIAPLHQNDSQNTPTPLPLTLSFLLAIEPHTKPPLLRIQTDPTIPSLSVELFFPERSVVGGDLSGEVELGLSGKAAQESEVVMVMVTRWLREKDVDVIAG